MKIWAATAIYTQIALVNIHIKCYFSRILRKKYENILKNLIRGSNNTQCRVPLKFFQWISVHSVHTDRRTSGEAKKSIFVLSSLKG